MYNCIYIKDKTGKLILEVRIVVTSGEEEEGWTSVFQDPRGLGPQPLPLGSGPEGRQ